MYGYLFLGFSMWWVDDCCVSEIDDSFDFIWLKDDLVVNLISIFLNSVGYSLCFEIFCF